MVFAPSHATEFVTDGSEPRIEIGREIVHIGHKAKIERNKDILN